MAITEAERFARRQRREERRERQRAQNIVRAAAMHEVRVAHEGGGGQRKSVEGRAEIPKHVVGCSGWFYWHWRQCFYPESTPANKWFDFYASKFRTVELNAPFYSWPTIATVKTWRRQAGRRRFIYAIKANELITHTKRLVGTRELVKDFYHIADLLGPRLGCFLFQLPPSFHYSAHALKRIVSQLDPTRRSVVEFRHRSWWNPRVYDAFKDAGIIFCSCSGPRLPDELVRTADDVYIRFHGTKQWYRHDYTKEELAVWVDRIRESGAKRVWAYFNNDRDAYALKNAREFLRQLKRGSTPTQTRSSDPDVFSD